MKRKSGSTLLIVIGLLFLAAALSLTVYNFWADQNARQTAAVVAGELSVMIEAQMPDPIPETPEEDSPITQEFEVQTVPYYVVNPEIEMLEQTIDGITYVGILDIPALELKLPIASQWSNRTAQKAPCRYSGTAYLNNMVIAGHNYQTHFGKLSSLPTGTTLSFTDMEGNRFDYRIVSFETLQPTAIEEMCTGDWDLTLFTCTIGGRARIAVRCEKGESEF